MKKIRSLLLLLPLSFVAASTLPGCGDNGEMKRRFDEDVIEISNRPIEKIAGSTYTAIRRVLYSRGVRECATIYGVDTSQSGREWLVFCAMDPPEEMTNDFTHYLWRVYTVWPTLGDVYSGNYTHHCKIIASDALEECPFARQEVK
ncbi:MAG: hypothetical protein ACT6Q8_24280 [Niveispirillum sp.]|uniref:hypothetical protein n=1 Tax=Niveispirillum sp. TaxID=1917217 RepID=UPI004035F2C0